MFKKFIFVILLASTISFAKAEAEECKRLAIEKTTYSCPKIVEACIVGNVTRGQIDIILENGRIYGSFGLPFCGVTHRDQSYCKYSSTGNKILQLYPENPDSYDFSGLITLGTFPIDEYSHYSCNYSIVN